MPADMGALTSDLAAESDDLLGMVRPLTDAQWELPTPAAGWAIRDQVGHLAFGDEAAALAATDPDRFRREADRLMSRGPDFVDLVAADSRGLGPAELLAWLSRVRADYLRVFAGLDPSARLPWFGPPMSAASSVTARLMETWAHGQDIADTLGIRREPTARLRHVTHLGVVTRGFSFSLRGQPVPDAPVRVVLAAPDGSAWTWGPEDAADRVEGAALDFCLLVTQRRHRSDTALRATGGTATAWLDLAQAFAGPPGPGRPPPAAVPPGEAVLPGEAESSAGSQAATGPGGRQR